MCFARKTFRWFWFHGFYSWCEYKLTGQTGNILAFDLHWIYTREQLSIMLINPCIHWKRHSWSTGRESKWKWEVEIGWKRRSRKTKQNKAKLIHDQWFCMHFMRKEGRCHGRPHNLCKDGVQLENWDTHQGGLWAKNVPLWIPGGASTVSCHSVQAPMGAALYGHLVAVLDSIGIPVPATKDDCLILV